MSVPEDAAVLLADFVSSLDNLPSEVHHILQEIGHKESKSHEIRNRALARDQSIQKHAKPTSQGGQGLLVANPKEEQLVNKIRSDMDRAEAAAKEKVALSERGVKLLSRHFKRLQAQLELLTSDVPPLPTLPSFTPSAQAPAAHGYATNQAYAASPAGQYAAYSGGQFGQNAAYSSYGTPGEKRRISAANSGAGTPSQIPLLPAQHGGQVLPGTPSSAYGYAGNPGSIRGAAGAGAAANLSRPSRLQNNGSYQGMPNNVAMLHQAQQQQQHHQLQQQQLAQQHQQHLGAGSNPQLSHQQQQQQLRMQQHAVQLAAQQLASQAQAQMQAQHLVAGGGHGHKRKRQDRDEEDALSVSVEGEAEAEGEDMTPYCFCHRPSFGEMIGCDNPTCAIEWFHLACVGLKTTPEGSWFCRDCQDKQQQQQHPHKKHHGGGQGGGGNRKGRRA